MSLIINKQNQVFPFLSYSDSSNLSQMNKNNQNSKSLIFLVFSNFLDMKEFFNEKIFLLTLPKDFLFFFRKNSPTSFFFIIS